MILEFEKSEKSLLELIRSACPGVLEAPCGGRGSCGKCLVRVWGRLRSLDRNETITAEGELLCACRYAPEGLCRVETAEQKADSSLLHKAPSGALGLAADIGSTTLELVLMELESGTELIRRRELNAQRSFGADVLSRVQALRGENGREVYACLHRQIQAIVGEMCTEIGAESSQVERAVICGNTIMEHFAAGLDPSSIALPPFEPQSRFTDWGVERAGSTCPQVYYCPCLSGYAGGDLIAGLSLGSGEGLELYMDIGTNGELALGGCEGYICCAAAAGPAFEGAELSCGMGGKPGAIYRVSPEGDDISVSVIGEGEAKGVCGSGVIDAVAAMLELGVIGRSGRFARKESLGQKLAARVQQREGQKVFMLSRDVYLSAEDIRKVQLAKAAIRAGSELMLRRSGKSSADIERITLAGGFGSAINRESAERIGLIPRCENAQLSYAGNAAVRGAEAALYPEGRERIERTLELCSYIELSNDRGFSPLYLENLNF